MEPEGSLPCPQQPAAHPVLNYMNPIHILPPYFPKIHSNIILPSVRFRISNWNLVLIFSLSHPCYMPAHHTLLELIFGEGHKLWSSSLCSLLSLSSYYFVCLVSKYSS